MPPIPKPVENQVPAAAGDLAAPARGFGYPDLVKPPGYWKQSCRTAAQYLAGGTFPRCSHERKDPKVRHRWTPSPP